MWTPPTTWEDALSLTRTYGERCAALNELWSFYLGDHERFVLRRDGETAEDFQRRPKIVSNVTGLALDTKVSYLYGSPLSRRLLGASPALSARVAEVWDDNAMALFMQTVATEALVTGDAYVVPKWITDLDDPLRLTLWPKQSVFPITAPDDGSTVVAYVYRYDYQIDPNTIQSPTLPERVAMLKGQMVDRVHLEVVTRDIWQVWDDGARVTDQEVGGGINPYGMLPVAHFLNRPLPHSFEGESDIRDLRTLQLEINARLSDVAEVVQYHAAPILQGKNIKAKQISRDAKRFFGVTELPGQNAGFEYVTYDGAMASSKLVIDYLLTEFSKVSRVPPTALGNLEELGNLTSGRALKVMYGPLDADIRQKQMLYTQGEQQLLDALLAVLRYHDPSLGAEEVRLHLGWPEQLIPQDPLETASTYQVLMSLGLASRREYLRTAFPLLPDRVVDGEAIWDTAPASLDDLEAEIDAELQAKMDRALNGNLPHTATQGTMDQTAAKAAGRARAGFGPEPGVSQ